MRNLKAMLPEILVAGPLNIFEKVLAFNSRTEALEKMVQIRLGLSSGTVFEGIPLKKDVEGNTLLFGANGNLGYVNIGSLISVEIMNPDLSLSLLTDGAFFEVPESEIPTGLQLKRNVKAIADAMQTDLGVVLDLEAVLAKSLTDKEKYQLKPFLRALATVLGQIAADPLGKEAISSYKSIVLETHDGPLKVDRNQDTLMVAIDLNQKLPVALEQNLKEKIETIV